MKTISRSIYQAFGVVVLASVALLSQVQAVVPPPDGAYPNFTTAEGQSALQSLTSGAANTALGAYTLFSTTTASFNTAVGALALDLNTGDSNTAVGVAALLLNTGTENTALGVDALGFNTAGESNTAVGTFALYNNATGSNNTAVGDFALEAVTAGDFNTALGANAGSDPDIGSNNLYLGDTGFGGDTNTIAIGGIAASGTLYEACFIGAISGATVSVDAVPVLIDPDGRLGTVAAGAKGMPRLRRGNGVQPQARFNHKVERLEATATEQQKQIAHQQKQISRQQRQIEVLMAQLKEQAAQIQKVSAQIEVSKAAPRTVLNNR
jgi:hypothetical protein